MKALKAILGTFFILSVITEAEEEKTPWVDLPAKYATELPECDRIEVFLLGGGIQNEDGDGTFPIRPYRQFSKIVKKRELTGEDAKLLCGDWRSLTFDRWSQAWCHFPICGLRFYQADKLKFETSVCFGCSNFYYPLDGGGTSWHGFRKDDAAGKNLIARLSKIIPRPENANKREAGTGQTATRPESDAEGSDKPQPESEERSR
jgi:hypothetical protein